ncbi:MAG: enoyl-ACP reductase FabI [Gammaproteobacteria bacterium]
MSFLAGKKALIVGVASNRSIAWGVAQAMRREGADLAFTYLGEKLRGRVEKMAEECGSDIVMPCDVSNDEEIDQTFATLKEKWGHLDIIVHAVAFANREELQGDYHENTTREGFLLAHEISSYSFTALAKAGYPLMEGRNGALLTMSYLGAVRAIPHYNVMGLAKASLEASVRYLAYSLGPKGIRANAISAGPIKTLAAAGIGDFRKLLEHGARFSPLRRNVTIEEVGNVAAFLCSDLASAITGEITYVDCGYNITAMDIAE